MKEILALDIDDTSLAYCQQFIEYVNAEQVVADMAYSSRKNLDVAFELGLIPYIPFKKNATGLVKLLEQLGLKPYIFPKKNIIVNSKGNKEWTRMYLELFNDVQNWLKEYHQRSHAESFHSAFKRRFGIITKRRPRAQLSQITARIILHNRKRKAYFSKLTNAN